MITRALVLLAFPRFLTTNTANARDENGTSIFRHVSSKFSTCSLSPENGVTRARRDKKKIPGKTKRNDSEARLFPVLPKKKNSFVEDIRVKGSV